MNYSVERDLGGKTITIETGKYAEQADAAVTVRCGDTIVLATAVVSPTIRPNIDFMPLTVDYEERLYARGKIPGSFFRREGRPGTEAILFGRLADRPIRPLFPKGFYNDVQIIITILSVDQENPPEVLGLVGASAALSLSGAPFDGPIGATKVGMIDGTYILNPTYDEIERGRLAVVVAGTRDAIMMVEAGSKEVSEESVLTAIEKGQEANVLVVDMIDEMVAAVGKPKMDFVPPSADEGLDREINTILDGRLSQVLEAGLEKSQREHAVNELELEVRGRLEDQYSREAVGAAFESLIEKLMRTRILEVGLRPDGRGLTDIRPISCEVGVLPRTHGTGLFTRGQTQVLSVATLASIGMKQIVDSLAPENRKRYLHHYNFTPYSTGEVKRVGSPGRREIGHGALAERAIEAMLPSEEDFPYAIRVVSEVLSSNGSTSMASVCGSSLALMDAGVPIGSPVAGVAMGLIKGENNQFAILTDIQGMEDHLGDMDFKVAGTAEGINALQMDIKTRGLTMDVLAKALEQARVGRLFILDKMREAITEPRSNLSPYAPKMLRITIPVDKIGALIGPGGRTVRAIQEELNVNIDTEDSGVVIISAQDDKSMQRAKDRIEGLTRELAVGDIFTGKVVRFTSFGAFVELLPGKDGLLRQEELGESDEELKMDQELTVMVHEIDHLGRINLSRRALLGETSPTSDDSPPRGPRPFQDRPRPGGPAPGSRGPGPRSDRGPSGFGGGGRGPSRGPSQGRGPGQGGGPGQGRPPSRPSNNPGFLGR